MMKYAIEKYRYYGYIQWTMEKRVESKLNQAFFTHFLSILKIFKVKYAKDKTLWNFENSSSNNGQK